MKKHRGVTSGRIGNFLSTGNFLDASVFNQIYGKKFDIVVKKLVFDSKTPKSSSKENLSRTFSEIKQIEKFVQVKVGDKFGPSFSTHWFLLEIKVSEDDISMLDSDEEFHLLWNCSAEGLLFSNEGKLLQGFTGTSGDTKRWDFPISKDQAKGCKFYMELSCNGLFGCARDTNLINPPSMEKEFTLEKAELSVFCRTAYDLYLKTRIMYNFSKEGEKTNPARANKALKICNDIVNAFDRNDKSTWKKCLDLADRFFKLKNGDASHNVYLIGHSHLDIAWLWPYSESVRKAARTFASQLKLMEEYKNYQFVQSQTILFDWMKELYPNLWKRFLEKEKTGNMVPVGGTYVEFDGNLPGGESMVRQFLIGQHTFQREFGYKSNIFWLPDSFGFSAQLPQIMSLCQIDYFLSQKLSWNLINKFPHSTFYWQGISPAGKKILSHFPPADTYCAQVKVDELIRTVNNNKDNDRTNESLMLFGHGDGGAGPKREHVDVLEICRNVDGLPKLIQSSPVKFFEDVSKNEDLLSHKGELYLELHRGTYTSQANTKKYNRKSEFLLRNVESLYSVLSKDLKNNYPKKELDHMWKRVLLNQFHDVLPGSSIEMVYDDALRYYKEVEKMGKELIDEFGKKFMKSEKGKFTFFNSLAFNRKQVMEITHEGEIEGSQKIENGKHLCIVECPSMGYKTYSTKSFPKIQEEEKVKVKMGGDGKTIEMENKFVRVVVKENGMIDLYDKQTKGRKKIFGGNEFSIFDDIPLYWDAWDCEIFHIETRKSVSKMRNDHTIEIVEKGPIRASVKVLIKISEKSSIEQMIHLDCLSQKVEFVTKVDWNESRKMLKVEFPTRINSDKATYEIQFGHLERTTLSNSNQDIAKFEVSNQKFFDLSEHGYGVSLLNDCKYGCSTLKDVMTLSLLRSPKAPDEHCDMGEHLIKYAILPHSGTFQSANVIQEGYSLNCPILTFTEKVINENEEKALFKCNDEAIVVEAVKKSEIGNDLVIRLYESHNSKVYDAEFSVDLNISEVFLCDCLEENDKKLQIEKKDGVTKFCLDFENFEIKTIKLKML